MKVIKKINALRTEIAKAKLKQKTIGFVPTMGYFHEGHLSLMRQSKKENGLTVVSIFVNPKQFAPGEDFARYPRDFKHDELFARREKVDIMFYPSADEMYPEGYLTYVEVAKLSKGLCGKFRPGHFRGVATVVVKLLNIVSADVLYLGQKDAQQAILIKKMIEDLNLPIKTKILPTVREKDGLAMSSRNRCLTPPQRKEAPRLFAALLHARKLIAQGEQNSKTIIASLTQRLTAAPSFKIDYIECVDINTLAPLAISRGKTLIALAAWLDKTRLIDNIVVDIR